jgi:hypothetical protein
MRNFMRIGDCDVLQLMLAIQRRPELWAEDSFLRHYPQGPFGEVESIMLRFPEKVVFEGDDAEEKLALYKTNMLPGFDQHESMDYPAYKTLAEARPLVMSLMARVQGERLGRVMINKICPGGRIFPHADTPEHANYYSRFHIVLKSAPGVLFRSGDEQAYMPTGDVWWFNNKLDHEVINNSGIDRIHMIVDIRTSK